MYKKNKLPIVSIVMPVFNHCSDVATMVDSIISNDFTDWELLAIDDGSDQKTLDLLHEYAAKDKRLKVIIRNRAPKGAQTCRNIGMEKAEGEYIVFFDSDDYIAPYCLRQRVEAIANHAELDFMVFPSGIYQKERFLNIAHPYVYGYKIFDDDIAQFSKRQLPFIVWNNIYRTSSLRKHGLKWDVHLLSLQDADFNISSIACGMRYAYATNAKADYGYRIASKSSVSKNIQGSKHISSHLYATKKMCEVVHSFCGSRYDWHLFKGALSIYNQCMSGAGLNNEFAESLIETLHCCNCRYWLLLRFQVIATHVLHLFLPEKLSRQIPMGFYLIGRTYAEHKKNKHLQSLGLIKE